MMRHVNFTRGYHAFHGGNSSDLSEEELKALEAVTQICDPHLMQGISINSGIETNEIIPTLKVVCYFTQNN